MMGNFHFQRIKLKQNLEKLIFNISNDPILNNVKREFFLQISVFTLDVEAKGFFVVDRKFAAAVSHCHH